MELSPEQFQRYARHIVLPQVGLVGQKKLLNTRVLCIGAGGLGSPVAMYLAASGVGRIGIVDYDVVDLTNLHRQILHSTEDIGRPKTESALQALKRINPDVQVDVYQTKLTSSNAISIIESYDIVIDGTDNFPTRYLTNDACVMLKKPNIYGSIFQFEGQASVFAPHLAGPCYRCLYPEPPPPGAVPSCAEGGVFGVLPGLIGMIQATETIKLVLGIGESLIGRLLLYNALEMKFREIKVRKDPACPVCGEKPTITKLIDYEQYCSGKAAPTEAINEDEVTVFDLKEVIDNGKTDVKLIDVRELEEYRIAKIPGFSLYPMSTLERRYSELDPSQKYYILCKSGGRSLKAVKFLKERGFKYVKSIKGGITLWSELIDKTVPKY